MSGIGGKPDRRRAVVACHARAGSVVRCGVVYDARRYPEKRTVRAPLKNSGGVATHAIQRRDRVAGILPGRSRTIVTGGTGRCWRLCRWPGRIGSGRVRKAGPQERCVIGGIRCGMASHAIRRCRHVVRDDTGFGLGVLRYVCPGMAVRAQTRRRISQGSLVKDHVQECRVGRKRGEQVGNRVGMTDVTGIPG